MPTATMATPLPQNALMSLVKYSQLSGLIICQLFQEGKKPVCPRQVCIPGNETEV